MENKKLVSQLVQDKTDKKVQGMARSKYTKQNNGLLTFIRMSLTSTNYDDHNTDDEYHQYGTDYYC